MSISEINKMHAFFFNNGKIITNQVDEEIIIEVMNLKKKFGDFYAVNGVDFQIQKGELFSLLGPNGAGKSTIIRMLTTTLKLSEGNVTISGYNLKKEKEEIKKLIGVCPQNNVIYGLLSAEQNVEFVAKMHGLSNEETKERVHYLLDVMNISGRKDSSRNFSGGMKKRLNLVMSLIHSPRILFLDEPSAGLDPQARRLVWNFIKSLKQFGITIILTTHDMAEADVLSDHIAIIDKGKIIAFGTPDELKEKSNKDQEIDITFKNDEDCVYTKSKLQHLSNITDIFELSGIMLKIRYTGGINTLKNEILENSKNIISLNLKERTLEDVFLKLTGRSLRD